MQNGARLLHMRIDGLAGDEKMLNLARPLEDSIDAHVAHHPLHRIGLLPTRSERLCRLESATAANLYQEVDDVPRHLGVEELGHGCFQPQIDFTAIRQT